ncbi:unnamed protein product [Thlaspi arvense]|uniref:RRM domain-containing protein n=1 Tax=Thlaspi arvense TaxID=13288 RepID=A0AAU9SSW4_THLAR|nr:unnamed protein product [Thlaspi arvense]
MKQTKLMMIYQKRSSSLAERPPAGGKLEEMALSQSTSFSTFQTPSHEYQFVGTSQNPRALTFPTKKTHRYPLISSFRTARSKPWSPLRTISCVALNGDLSEDGTRDSTSLPTSTSSVFVKGFPDSVSEGRLRKVFSEFGEVSNVKIIANERTRQSLGYGYVWFSSNEDAQLAVEAMNGKV